jgi:hypothetical protein
MFICLALNLEDPHGIACAPWLLFCNSIHHIFDLTHPLKNNKIGFSGAETISYWFGQIGFLMTLPIYVTIGLERGFR